MPKTREKMGLEFTIVKKHGFRVYNNKNGFMLYNSSWSWPYHSNLSRAFVVEVVVILLIIWSVEL